MLVGRCYDLTETPPYGPWIELFARYRPPTSLPPPPAPSPCAAPSARSPARTRSSAQVLDFLAALCAPPPLVLLLDDLHWADPASLDLLRFLARSLATLPLLLLATYRADELTRRHPLYPLCPLLVREAGAERVDLHPLDDDAVRALVEARYRLAGGEADAPGRATCSGGRRGTRSSSASCCARWKRRGSLRGTGDGWRLGDLAGAARPAAAAPGDRGRARRGWARRRGGCSRWRR